MNDEQSINPTDEKLKALASKIDELNNKIKIEDSEKEHTPKQKEKWWTVIVGILGIPALIITIWLQASQTRQTDAQTETERIQQSKLRTEELKLRTDELKTRAELQKLLDELAKKPTETLERYEDKINSTLPRIEKTIEALDRIEVQKQEQFRSSIVTKIILLGIFIYFVNLVFDVVSMIWSYLTTGLMMVTTKLSKKWRNKIGISAAVLSNVPNLARIAIFIFIFGAVMVPLFNEILSTGGSNIEFGHILSSFRSLNIGEAVNILKEALFN